MRNRRRLSGRSRRVSPYKCLLDDTRRQLRKPRPVIRVKVEVTVDAAGQIQEEVIKEMEVV